TSPNTTVIVIEGNRSRYMTGDTFKATIYAKDRLGRPKKFGGDFFRARLLRNTGFVIIPDGIPCVIIDHSNGSYSITAPLVQAAVFTLEVVLVSSLEAISRLIQFTATNREIGRVYLAELESGEKVHCNVDMSAYPINTETCDYSNPRNQEPWFCIKPPSGVCSRIINIVFSEMPDEEPIHNFAATLKSKYETMSIIKGSGLKLLVLPQESADVSSLEDCVVKNHKHVRPNGYMWGGRWVSLTCANTLLAVRDTQRCLENKVVYFFGDSTIRMYSILLGERLNLRSVGPDSHHIWQNPKTIYSFGLNITTYYRAHGPPLQNPGGPETRPYISDSLDGIRVAGKDTFIIFNVGAHLHKFHPSIFIHRMQGIRDAVLRLLSRFPETRIIYRGLSVLSSPLDWYFYRYDVIVRDIFKDIENFMFLDFWDLTTVVPQNDIHPPAYFTELKSLVLFDYLC
uniref:NXPE C-terminal domain-containing protein n=1 Tax=Ciona savignyi TaxID=51511 RepID=H2ZEU8_CIOSA